MKCENLTLLLNRVEAICAVLKIKPIELARDLGVNRSQVTRWITKRQTKPTGEAVMKLQDWTVAKFKEITKRRLTTRYQIDLAMVILNRR